MLIKIIRLHVSLELPDGDCIGGRLQLVFSFFLFSPPALKKKKKCGGGRQGVGGERQLWHVWDGCVRGACYCTQRKCLSNMSNYINAQLYDYIYKSLCFGFFSFTRITTWRKISLLFRMCPCEGDCNFPVKVPVPLGLIFCLWLEAKQHLEPAKTESLFFSGLWPLLNTPSPKEGYVLQCVFRKA